MRLFPVKGTFFPLVDKTHDQNAQKNHTRPKTHNTNFLERNRPREQESDFQVKQNEEDGHQVLAHIKLHAGIFKRL